MGPEAAVATVDAVSKMGTGVAAATEGGVAAGGITPALEAAAMPEVIVPATAPVMEQMTFHDIGGADFVDQAAQQAASSAAPNAEAEIQELVDKFTTDDFDEVTLDRLAAAENAGNLKWENGQPVIGNTAAGEAGDPISTDRQPMIGQPNDILNATRIGGVPGEIPRVREPSLDTANPPTRPASTEQSNKSADQTGNDVVQPTEKPNDSSDVVPIETPIETNEPESLRDKLSARVDELQARENPTPEDQRELSKARLEIAERDRRDVLNAAEPDSLSAEDAAEKAELNEKYGKLNTEAAIENASPAAPATEVANEPIDPGEFNEQAVRDQIEADRNRKNWSQDQKDAYVNAQRADHEKKKADYEAAMKERTDTENRTTEQQKEALDQELEQVNEDLINGKITAQEASMILRGNRSARERIVRSLIEKHQSGKEMTPYEQEVAEKGMQMRQLMRQIQMAPKIMNAMESTIRKLKDEYREAAKFEITDANAESEEARANIDLRARLSNQIASQASYMAQFADIVSINVNEFKSVNSNLMQLIGVRNGLHDMIVQIGTGIVRRAKRHQLSINAKDIAARA